MLNQAQHELGCISRLQLALSMPHTFVLCRDANDGVGAQRAATPAPLPAGLSVIDERDWLDEDESDGPVAPHAMATGDDDDEQEEDGAMKAAGTGGPRSGGAAGGKEKSDKGSSMCLLL